MRIRRTEEAIATAHRSRPRDHQETRIQSRNRARAQANLEAATILLTLVPEFGARVATLTIDGAPAADTGALIAGVPIRHPIRRRAEIIIPGWGGAELTRGSDVRGLDQIEAELRELDRNFAEELAPFGVSAGDATALDQLRGLAADKKVGEPELQRRQEEIDRLAPRGLDPLREELVQLERIQQALESDQAVQAHGADRLADPVEWNDVR